MNSNLLRIGFAVLMIAHGLVHASLAAVPTPKPTELRTPFWPGWWRSAVDEHWLAARLGLNADIVRTAGWLLWLAALIGFSTAGLGLLGVPGLAGAWRGLTAAAALLSLVLFLFYWHPWLFVGVLLDGICLAAAWFGTIQIES
jgi:hypothetical protein